MLCLVATNLIATLKPRHTMTVGRTTSYTHLLGDNDFIVATLSLLARNVEAKVAQRQAVETLMLGSCGVATDPTWSAISLQTFIN